MGEILGKSEICENYIWEKFIAHNCHENITHLVGIFSPMYGSCLNTSMILARKVSMPSLSILRRSPSCPWEKYIKPSNCIGMCIGTHYTTKGF